MKTPVELWLALMKIARDDTGADGLVELTGRQLPIRRVKNPALLDPPGIAVLGASPFDQGAGTVDEWDGRVRFDVQVPRDEEALLGQILDRLTDVITQPRLEAQGVDARLGRWQVQDLAELSEETHRAAIEVPVAFTR